MESDRIKSFLTRTERWGNETSKRMAYLRQVRQEIKVKPISELEFMPIGDYFTPSPIFEDGNVRGEIKEIHSNRLFPFDRTYDL